MNAKQLKLLISEIVRAEVKLHREDIIKEVLTDVKAELFDVMIKGGTQVGRPRQPEPVIESTNTDPEIDRTSLRKLFEQRLLDASDGDFTNPTLAEVPASRTPTELPPTYTGRSEHLGTNTKPDDLNRAYEAITKDYSAVMSAMNKKR